MRSSSREPQAGRASLRTRSHALAALALLALLGAVEVVEANSPPSLTALAPYTPLASGLKEPRGVAAAPGGAVYISDEHDGIIYEVSPAGVRRVVASGLKKPRGLAFVAPGSLLVAADKTPPPNPGPPGVLLSVDVATGAVSVRATGIKEPRGVAVGSDGSVYVTAKGLHDVEDEEGLVLRVAGDGALEILAQGFKKPDGLAVDGDGALLVAAEAYGEGAAEQRGSLFRVAPGGAVTRLLATELKEPGGLARDVAGAAFVAGRDHTGSLGSVLKRRPGGASNSFASGLRKPAGAAFAPDGDLIVADSQEGIVWRFDAPPPPNVNAPDPSYTRVNPFGLSGSAQAGALVTISGGTGEVSATTNAGGAWSADVALLANADNPLTVLAAGAGGQGLSGAARQVHVIHDDIAPAIAAVRNPAANAAGWNNSDVSVSFACSDGGSGVASCPAALVFAAEGAGQQASGTAVDRAGNSASVSATVNIDKTAPSVSASAAPAPNGFGWNSAPVTVTFTCEDLLSGVAACSDPALVGAEGVGQVRAGTATDVAGNQATTQLTLNLDLTPPELTQHPVPAPNQRGWNNSAVTVSYQATDALSGIDEISEPQTLSEEGTDLNLFGTARDKAGNMVTSVFTTNIDLTPPSVAITAPEPGLVRRVPRVDVAGTAADANGLAAVRLDGRDLGAGSPWSGEATLDQEGPHTVVAQAEDIAGNTTSASVDVVLGVPPTITITSPADLTAVGTTPITVTGTIDDPQAVVKVGLEAVPAVVSGNTFTATGVPLREGGNVITVAAADTLGNATSAAITVVLDTTAPRVLIDSPRAGSVTTAETVTVSGRINDVVLGTVNGGQAQVNVNGIAAEVRNRTFVARNVPLQPGSNAVTAVATDAVGNSDAQTVSVLREDIPGPRVSVASGDGQSARAGEALPEPLVVRVTDGLGQPLAGRSVVFRVSANSGELEGPDGARARGLVVPTDDDGLASARLTLGSRAGVGNNRIEATSPGIVGAAQFSASGTARAADKVNVDSGGGQIGAVGQPLPRPFVAVVTDAGHNRLPGVPVTFRVLEGGGLLGDGEQLTVLSDGDGRAVAVLTLGPRAGVANNVVGAFAEGLEDQPATFDASAREPGDPAATSVSGVVLDNSNVPLAGVTLRVRGTALAVASDAQGQFRLQGVPVGNVHLQVDGSTAQRPGVWPNLEFELVTVPGIDNTLGMPVYLVQLDTQHAIFVDETHGGTLTLPEYPGFSLTVAPNSATFPDGTRRGTISVTPVHVDKVPMVPNFGQQPRFIVTIQPPGVRFDPPAQVMHPNVDGLKAGEVTEIYSFDHDMGSFVATGTATISEDGTLLRSDPGMGIIKGGWHCGGNPGGSGTTHDCPQCKKCDGSSCVNDDSAGCDDGDPCTSSDGENQGPDKCKGGACEGKKINFREVSVGAEFDALPDALKTRVNNALKSVSFFGTLQLKELKLGAEGSVKDCCEKTTGVIPQGRKEVKASFNLSASIEDVQLWPPKPAPRFSTSFRKFIPIPFTNHIASVEADLDFGVFGQGSLSFSATGGRSQDLCKDKDCAFGEVKGTSTVGLKATARAIACVDATWSVRRCADLDLTAAASTTVSVSGTINRPECGDPLKGKLSVGQVKLKFSFGLGFTNPAPQNYETSVESEGWKLDFPFKLTYSKTILDALDIPF